MTTTTSIPAKPRIFWGNYRDTHPGHNCVYYTWQRDVRCVTSEDREVFARCEHRTGYGDTWITGIDPVEIHDEVELEWGETPIELKEWYFYHSCPAGTEEELNIFLYGEVDGARLNEYTLWVQTHKVYSEAATRWLLSKIGRWETVEGLGTRSRQVGTGYKDYLYLVDNRWQFTVSANHYDGRHGFSDGYELEDYSKVLEERKAYGRRIARLANAAGVPWGVATLVAHHADQDALRLLRQLKAAKEEAEVDSHLQWELTCGIVRRKAAIRQVLGELMDRLDCETQLASSRLAEYLLS